MSQTHTQRRKSGFYFRQKVPVDLIGHFCAREIVRSLKATKVREANALRYEQGHYWAQEFDRIRAGGLQAVPRKKAEEQGLLEALSALPTQQVVLRRAGAKAQIVLRLIEDALISKVCSSYLREIIDADAEVRADCGEHGEIHQFWSGVMEGPTAKELGQMLRGGPRSDVVTGMLSQYLERLGYSAATGVSGFGKLYVRFLETLIRARQSIDARNNGRPIDTESLAPLGSTFSANSDRLGLTISGLHTLWAAKKTSTDKTTDEFLSIIHKFEAFVVGQYRTDQAANVKKDYVISYRDELLEEGLHVRTVSKKLAIIKLLFNSAIDDGRLGPSEVQSVKVGKPKKKQSKPRVPFECEDLKVIFAPEHYLRAPMVAPSATFLPPAACYSGARIEELAQLRVGDVRSHRGRPFLSIIDGDGQVLKNEESRRVVPVHEELIRCGFMQYVESARKAKQEWLFPELTQDKYGRRSSAFSKTWNRQLKRILAPVGGARGKVFHSFRHLWKHTARACGIVEEVHDALSGHAHQRQSEGRHYGKGSYPEEPLFEGMAQFKISGFDLSHLYVD